MKPPIALLFILLLFSLLGTKTPVAALVVDDVSRPVRTILQAHCSGCHGAKGKTEGDVDLAALKTDQDFISRPQLIEDILQAVSDKVMPPEDKPPLPHKTREQLLDGLKSLLSTSLKSQPFITTPIRRMNRFQYNNAVVDLLELDREIFRLNERLMRRREDYFHPQSKKMPDQVRISIRPLSKDIDNQRPEGLKGVAAFPQDQRAEFGFDNRADHLTLSPLLMESFLKLSQTIAESPDLNQRECRSWDWLFSSPAQAAPKPPTARYEAEGKGGLQLAANNKQPAATQGMKVFQGQWSNDAQLFWRCPGKDQELNFSMEVTQQGAGLRFGLTRARDYGIFQLFLDGKKIGQPIDLYNPAVKLEMYTIPKLDVGAGPHTLRFKCLGKNPKSTGHFFGLDYVELTGQKPAKTSKEKVPTELEIIRARLAKLLRRAFRKPVERETLERFTQFTQKQRQAGESFEQTMRTVVGAVIGMPDFLYFYEEQVKEPPKTKTVRQRVNDFELAARLSSFFWSSIPDDTLLDLAETGKLSDPQVFSAQVERMMNDRRSSRFCDNFPAQWLQLDRLITSVPDPKMYPYFYLVDGYRTSMHMISEPLLLFETVYLEDRSIMELIDPKFTWENNMLRANYAGHSKAGHDVVTQLFKRVPLSDPRRGGVITNAAVMTMTSTPTRTQPITRGAWVNAVIFNDPPEPPPADVPPLPENNKAELEKLTIRERLAVHRQRKDCAGCHNKIDPFGFALENYGPTGVWRDKYPNGRTVDASSVLFNQYPFKSLAEFKKIIVQEKHRFIKAFAGHLLSYALGRELGPADSPTLDAITQKAISGQDSLRTIMKSIATSEPFLHKR